MKGIFPFIGRGTSKTRVGFLFVICFLAAGFSNGAPLKSAHVSRVIHDVRLLPSNAAPRPAAVNDNIVEGTAVRTGVESRAELTFADLTVTRLGENTIFSFNEGARELDVTKGAILLEVPSKAPPVKINTAAVTAGVMGGTALFATGPPIKFMVLEGVGTFYPAGHPEKTVTVHAGEMVVLTADGHITQPAKFNVELVLQTSQLIVDFPDLASLPLILEVVNQQLAEESAATPNPPPSKDPLLDVIDLLTQNVTANPVVVSFTATPTPGPSRPPVITSPVPYLINNRTAIVTHPTITTNGVTDLGATYHGRAKNGPVSAFAFGSTSIFDNASGFNNEVRNNQAAVFKFTSLELAGNPTIHKKNGPTRLGLIALDEITSGGSGGTLTFAGIRGMLLATQNGPVNLGSDVSFSGFHDLTIYARGANSDLTLGSDINTRSKVALFAERDMSITSTITTDDLYAFVGRNVAISGPGVINAPTITLSTGQNLTWNGQTSDETAVSSDGDVNVSAGQAINIANGLSISRANGGFGSGLNLALSAGTDLTAGNSLAIEVDNSAGGSLDTGGNITLNAGGNLTVNGDLSLTVNNSNGNIGTGGNISISTGGNLAASSILAEIDNAGGSIGGSAAINMNVSGTASVTTDAIFEILGSDGVAKGAAINFNGGTYAVGGTFLSTIDGEGAITFNNATVRADVVKVGVFGNNGTLTIGGGAISATTLLKLYAPGSNGTLNFVANVTLTSGSPASLAANTITIQPSVLVTIRGADGRSANVYTNDPNYSGFGGNNPANGTFGGNGARNPQPLANAPPFGDPPANNSRTAQIGQGERRSRLAQSTAGNAGVAAADRSNGDADLPLTTGTPAKQGYATTASGKGRGVAINVTNSNELLDLLDKAVPTPSRSARKSSATAARTATRRRTDNSSKSPRSSSTPSPDLIRVRNDGTRASPGLQ